MSGFKDPEAAASTAKRIDDLTLRPGSAFLLAAASGTSRPDQAIAGLERWLAASGNASTMFDAMTASPELGRLLVALFGASHQVADVIVQNPELAFVVLDPEALNEKRDLQSCLRQAQGALAESTSYTHSLDRLRFLKQRWHTQIAAADLGGLWPEREVWSQLSLASESLIVAARDVVWNHVAQQKGHQGPCPVSIVGMGKLGGQELNFSSDIDLIFVLEDDADDDLEKLCTRFCEVLSRGLSDRMGRGALYRVDLRLRPYGSRGAIAPRMSAVEGYFDRYAEAWEHLALVRSRVLAGSEDVRNRWRSMRDSVCFQGARGEWFVEDLLKMRTRMEDLHDEWDLKRSAGGIRDVEFLVQIFQLLHGKGAPELKDCSTLEGLAALERLGLLGSQAADDLSAAYTFLRQVEHRLQLLGDRQTHSVPADAEERRALARRTGISSLESFDSVLALHRGNARAHYDALLRPMKGLGPRDEVARRSGDYAAVLTQWIDSLPMSDSFYESLKENDSSLQRFLKIASHAPALVPWLQRHVSVTEQVMSGEVLEDVQGTSVTLARSEDTLPFAQAIRRAWLRTIVRSVLTNGFDELPRSLSRVYDEVVAALTKGTGLRVIALGSYGGREMSLYSDLDVVFWKDGELNHEVDERNAQQVMAKAQALHSAGAPIELDTRLRPDGRKGRLVQNHETVSHYAESALEPWERLALGRARASVPLPGAIRSIAYGRPIDEAIAASLADVKRRVETERVPLRSRGRHIKLGRGGQDDVLWTVQILYWECSHSVSLDAVSVLDRIPELVRAKALSESEGSVLEAAWRFYSALRINLALQGLDDEALPDDPDKLSRLTEAMSLRQEGGVEEAYRRSVESVRGVFEALMDRLGN